MPPIQSTKKYATKKPSAADILAERLMLSNRWDKKRTAVNTLVASMQKIRYNVTKDLQSENDTTRLKALAVYLMDKSAERVGNAESAADGHHGITNLKKSHITFDKDGNVYLDYTGKSGVDQEKKIHDARLVDGLKRAIKESPSKSVFVTKDGKVISPAMVNTYLKEHGISAKDIRGFAANKWMVKKLSAITEIPDKESKRKTLFNQAAKVVSEKVGHTRATLIKHYLLPEIKDSFIDKGEVYQLNPDKFRRGGEVDVLKPAKTLAELSQKHGVSVSTLARQLKTGIRVEMEHTNDPKVARIIALQHIEEIPDYYNRLMLMEDNAQDQEVKGKIKLKHGGKINKLDGEQKEEELYVDNLAIEDNPDVTFALKAGGSIDHEHLYKKWKELVE